MNSTDEGATRTVSEMNAPVSTRPRGSDAYFVTTNWSVVLTAGHSDSTRARVALEKLCQTYWYPLYAYVRRRGWSPHDAQDLTQAFFQTLLRQNWVGNADKERGRFRTFLLTSMSRFLAHEWDKLRAQKRGGGVVHVPVQLGDAETRYGYEPVDNTTPEQCFERRWALTLLDKVLERLRAEHERDGKSELFAALNPCLIGSRDTQPYAELAANLGMNESAVKVAVHRFRKRYRHLLREEIAETTASPEEVEEELHHLFAVLAGQT